MLPLLLKSNKLKESDINMIDMPVASMVPALLQGQVDAVLGSIDAYQIQAEAQGAQLDVPVRRLRRAHGEHVHLRQQRLLEEQPRTWSRSSLRQA
jgi:ABC-type nitrate/sulfonate/bicarbonate transport system substrate-binding protein